MSFGYAIVREAQYGEVKYTRTRVDNVKRGRVYVDYEPLWGGRSFYLKSGKNCWSPTSQTTLVLPHVIDDETPWSVAIDFERPRPIAFGRLEVLPPGAFGVSRRRVVVAPRGQYCPKS